jgi:dTMP kinase
MFIVVEGIDYAGKTTVIEQMTDILQKNGYGVCCTREPGGHTVGERVREILVSKDANKTEDKDVWGLLLAATRIEHGRHLIKPALREGKIVISSRYIFSTTVYQPEALQWCEKVTREHPDVVEPDLLIVCDVSTETAKKRKQMRSEAKPEDHDYMDDMWVPEWEEQRKRFLEIVWKNRDRAIAFSTESPLELQYKKLQHLLRHVGFKINEEEVN